jgi:Lysine methyltransferase
MDSVFRQLIAQRTAVVAIEEKQTTFTTKGIPESSVLWFISALFCVVFCRDVVLLPLGPYHHVSSLCSPSFSHSESFPPTDVRSYIHIYIYICMCVSSRGSKTQSPLLFKRIRTVVLAARSGKRSVDERKCLWSLLSHPHMRSPPLHSLTLTLTHAHSNTHAPTHFRTWFFHSHAHVLTLHSHCLILSCPLTQNTSRRRLPQQNLDLLEFIQDKDRFPAGFFAGKHVLELGSGTGLAGLLCASLGARTTLTDRADTVDLLRLNVQLNQPLLQKEQVSVQELEWGKTDCSTLAGHVDVLVAAECIYNLLYGDVLLSTMVCMCALLVLVLLLLLCRCVEVFLCMREYS